MPSSAVQLHEMNFPLGQGCCCSVAKAVSTVRRDKFGLKTVKELNTTVGRVMRPVFQVPGVVSIVVVHPRGVLWGQNQLAKLPLIHKV